MKKLLVFGIMILLVGVSIPSTGEIMEQLPLFMVRHQKPESLLQQ